jgi:hypothetical protein
MAVDQQLVSDLNFTAGADLSAKQYFFVKLSAANTVTVCAAATDIPIGVLQNAPESGQTAVVRPFGITKLYAGGAISAGNLIGTDSAGEADAKTSGTDTTNYVCGQALTAADDGDVFKALINCTNPNRAA